MARVISTIVTAIYFALLAWGGHHSIQHAAEWVQEKALEKSAQDLESMEKMSQNMTGGKLDF